jgi:diguanylate cyclase (GGDEF)-like protein
MLDIDQFKHINDQFGHAAGDEALKQIARFMKQQLRNSDTIARWGGDEFVLLLPNASLENAVFLLERIRQTISQIDLAQSEPVSFSCGVVEMEPDSTYQSMLAEADSLMYQSKKNGKNRVSSRIPNAAYAEG